MQFFKRFPILWVPLFFVALYIDLTILGLFIPHEKEMPGKKTYEIYMATGGIHVDFVLPVKNDVMDWTELVPLKDFEKLKTDPQYVMVGWGERDFYLNVPELKDITPPIAFTSLFLPTRSLMHVTYTSYLPRNYFEMKKVMISKGQYQKLVTYLTNAFQMKEGRPIVVPYKRYYKDPNFEDRFYEANGSYHLLNTCNMWTARGMYESGMKTSFFTPLKYGVTRFLD